MTASIAPNTQFIGLAKRTVYKIDRFIARGGEGEVYALKGRLFPCRQNIPHTDGSLEDEKACGHDPLFNTQYFKCCGLAR